NEVDCLAAADILYTWDPLDLRSADFHIVAVPTPINETRPDIRSLITASMTIGEHLKHGDIVVYESTVYPGTTEDECIPVLERKSGLKSGIDFFVAYSPERIVPGDKENTFTSITKIVSAQDEKTLDIVAGVYGSVTDVYRAPSIRVAEAAKLVENTQRDVNIALINELSLIFNKMDIDTRDVLAAAGTKWNFMRYEPGLVGGHCIGVDPYYLTHEAQVAGHISQIILAGRKINDSMGFYVAHLVIRYLIAHGIRPSTVTILGLPFKENVTDLRNTRVVDIVNELTDLSIDVQVHDPLACPQEAKEYGIELKAHLEPADAVVLAVAHREYIDRGWAGIIPLLRNGAGLVIDVKAVLPRSECPEGVTLWRL
ncbi:MAG: nucleotide sugar dehydrogenase, partial [Acidobacteria bacterium]|nr:nucleotide sugar dehydrogenase [Acidobacteriota bacterium]